jgi:hypothetical protein
VLLPGLPRFVERSTALGSVGGTGGGGGGGGHRAISPDGSALSLSPLSLSLSLLSLPPYATSVSGLKLLVYEASSY